VPAGGLQQAGRDRRPVAGGAVHPDRSVSG
jgi:hypothetical protein